MSDEEGGRRRGLPRQVKMRHDTHFVEDFEVRHGEPVGKLVPTASLEPDPEQPRAVMGSLDDLAASIRERGVLEPILVRPHPGAAEGAPPFRIISGERRWRAARQAGLLEVPIIEMPVGDGEALEIALIENLQRKDLTPFEEAEGYRALMERFELTQEQVATKVGKSRTVITEALGLLEMPARVRDAVQALGIQSKTILREVLKAGDEEAMLALVERVSDHGLSRDDLRREIRRKTRSARGRREPYVFRFRPRDRSFTVAVKFRSETVERQDLITALEEILQELKTAQSDD